MIKIVFFATPQLTIPSLDYLVKSPKIEVLAVVTQPDKPTGRGYKVLPSPVKKYALEHNIKVFQPKSLRKEFDIQDEIKKLEPDFFVTFAFGQILSQDVLDIPKYETINLHASLLPKYRGANPIQISLLNGDEKTGICTMITELGLDCGDVCMVEEIELSIQTNLENLFEEVSEKAPQLIEKTLIGLKNSTISPTKQDEKLVSFAPKLKKEDAKINWAKSATQIHNQVRALYKAPSAFCVFNGKQIKIMETKIFDEKKSGKAGEVLSVSKTGIEVQTQKGSILIMKVKPEGKGEMCCYDWANGAKICVGDFYD